MDGIINTLAQSSSTITKDFYLYFYDFIPIILTIITIVTSISIDKRNIQLQKNLSNRDILNQTRETIFEIYNAYLDGFYYVSQASGNIPEIFVSDQSFYKWALELENKNKEIVFAYNKSKLIFCDEELIKKIKEGFEIFSDLTSNVKLYIGTGFAFNVCENAWHQFSKMHSNVSPGNYFALLTNQEFAEEFKKYCSNQYTDEIQKQIEKYKMIVGVDSFDEMFKKYTKLSVLE